MLVALSKFGTIVIHCISSYNFAMPIEKPSVAALIAMMTPSVKHAWLQLESAIVERSGASNIAATKPVAETKTEPQT